MERAAWTDERIDDLVDHLYRVLKSIDDRLEKSSQDLRDEMRLMRADIQVVRTEMHEGDRELRHEVAALRRHMTTAALGLFSAAVAALVAVIVNGL